MRTRYRICSADDRRIFPDLTVRQNILIGSKRKGRSHLESGTNVILFSKIKSVGYPYGNTTQRWGTADAYYRPNLDDQSSTASLDEPGEGLAPLVIKAMQEQLERSRKWARLCSSGEHECRSRYSFERPRLRHG